MNIQEIQPEVTKVSEELTSIKQELASLVLKCSNSSTADFRLIVDAYNDLELVMNDMVKILKE